MTRFEHFTILYTITKGLTLRFLKIKQKSKYAGIVLYYEALYGRPIRRYRIGIPREMFEIRTQPWLSEGSLTCDLYHHRGPIF